MLFISHFTKPINAHSDQNQPDNFDEILQAKAELAFFKAEMFIGALSPTLLQIFCKIILNSKVIVKSIIDPDDNFWRNL